MKKIIYRTFISLILIVSILIIYVSTIGIKTDKFNDLIITKTNEIQPNLDIKIKKVSAKLDPFSLTINVKTLGTDLIYKNKLIELENIKAKISIKSLINNQFALLEIMISTKYIPINNLISLIRTIKSDHKLLMAEQLVESGYIIADLKFEFDEFGKINKNYDINGLVNNAQVSLLKKNINKLNFIFQISEKDLYFKDITFLLNNKSLIIPELKALKQKNEFFFSGKLKNKDFKIEENEIKEFTDNKFLKTNLKEIIFSSESNFTFEIDQNFKIRNSNIKSIIDVENLKIANFLVKNSMLPKMKNEIIFKEQKIELNYTENKITITGSGNIFLQDNSDVINYKIISHKDNLDFDINLKIIKNLLILDFLNYEKDKKSSLEVNIKGKSENKKLFFNKIIISENKNFISIKNLNLSKDYKIQEIGNVELDYKDKAKRKNKLQLKKDNKNYKIIGESFNIDKLITELLKSKKNDKQNFFSNNFNLQIEIKKVYLDKNNSINNLQGSIFLKDNTINELNLGAEFSKKQKINFTIKNNNGEKITTLFSNEAKPLVDRYKFIKGFSEGKLDFYSIKKNNKTKSTLKIYDFKLKELPALTKVLTLASLQGIADLLSGEGIRFNEFEMNFINQDNLMTIEEIYAIGPAISILMEGYIQKDNLISLRGTLVPATTINKTISSIPLIGNILVGKKVGEGVFGVSFKIKGPPKALETSVNPIKTLTPRFITRTLEKLKKN